MGSTRARSATVPPSDNPVSLESVLCTERLSRRPSRSPDYQKENHALTELVQALANSPGTILQALADTVLEVLPADSAGLSLLTTLDGGKRFYWPAIAGAWKPHVGGGTPRDFGPCGDVLDRNAPLLFSHFERRYPYLEEVTPAAEEALVVPFYAHGAAVGTIWAMAHDDRRRFDAEDLRQLEGLARFASAAYQAGELRQAEDSRRAALNLMEDAVQARRAEEQLNVDLRESEERYRTLFDLGPVAIYSIDHSGVIQKFNLRAAELWGREPALGDTDERFCGSFKLFRPDGSFMPHEQCPMAEVVSGKVLEACDAEVLIERPDGSRVTVVVNIRSLKNERGEITGAINCFYDITERQQAERALRESEERFRTLADNISQFAWTADEKGAIYWYNQRWYDYTGTTPDEMQDAGWKTPHHPDHLDRVIASIQRSLDTGEVWDDTFPLRGKDGSYRWFLTSSVPIRDAEGKVVRWFGTNTDVTEQREMANDLRQSVADLAAADRRKNEFLATLAHELRNPLAPIRNALQVMRMSSDNTDEVQVAKEMLERQVDQVVRLVDDLLDMSRISRGSIELRREPVELTSVVQLAVEAVRPACAGKGVELAVALPPHRIVLNADSVRLAQVLGNLLNNACKFTDTGGRVTLSVESDEGEAVIRVRDTGIGIAVDQLPRVFDMFAQVDSSIERSAGGLGIGLTLVKDLVERHGGTVQARSAGVGEGSEFEVRLPVATDIVTPAAAAAAAASHRSEPAATTGRRILVVDDNWDSATTMAMLLEFAGNETHKVHDGLAAVEAAATFKPDLVLLDIGLPKLNGYEVARRIRERPWGKNIVLVALTGWGQEEDRQKSRDAGFDAHVVKPVDYATLLSVLASHPVNSDQPG